MSSPKDHHYVPRSFFKPWANKILKVLVYERKNGVVLPPYRQSTKSICVQTGLYSYTTTVKEEQRNAIEQKLFSFVDTNGANVLRKLLEQDGVVKLTNQDRYYFAVFLSSLRIRTPESIRYNTQNTEKVLRESLKQNDPKLQEKDIEEVLEGQTLAQWAEKNHPAVLENTGHNLIAEFIIDEKFVTRIMDMYWVVVKRTSDITNLLTSDRPLVLIGNLKDSNLGFALAISPERVFIATSRPESISGVLKFAPKKFIHEMNKSTIQQAKNKAFAIDKSHELWFFERRLGRLHGILPWTETEKR